MLFSFLAAALAVGKDEKPVSKKPQILSCALKAKAVQAGSFWGGTYFDTSVTSEKIKALEISVPLEELKQGLIKAAEAKIKVEDQAIKVAEADDPDGLELEYKISMNQKFRSVSSTEEFVPLQADIKFGNQEFEKQFSMIPGHKAYVHFDVSDPKQFDLKITNVFLICSLSDK